MKTRIEKNKGREYYTDSATPNNPHGFVSKSLLWQVFKEGSPFKWKFGKHKKETTPAMAFGSLVHTLAFQPENFRDEYALSEWENFRTKAAQEWKAEVEASGKIVVSQDMHRTASDMAEIVKEELSITFPCDFDFEVAVYSEVATKCKGMIDAVPVDFEVLVDLKTTTSIPDEKAVVNLILNRGYHWQAAMYLDLYNAATGSNRDEFWFLFIETEAPHETAWVKISEKMLDAGRREYQDALHRWSECVRTGHWPKKINEPMTAELPAWYL